MFSDGMEVDSIEATDNPSKATGDPAEIDRYLRVFGGKGRDARPVTV